MEKEEYIGTEELRKMQKLILNIAKVVFQICKEENINLYMLGGTFLGAVRHKGFIPWDDDMDFALSRSDYNKFLNIIEKKLPSNLRLLHYSNVKDDEKNTINFHYIKIIDLNYQMVEKIGEGKFENRNLFVDIFPLDNIPNNYFINKFYKIKVFLKQEKMRLARLNIVYADGKFNGNSKIKKIIFKINKMLKISKKYNYYDTIKAFDKQIGRYSNQKNTKFVSNILGGNGLFKETFPKKCFEKVEEYDFEDTKLLGAKNYDYILKKMYSDYMQLPKEENRICKHCMKINKIN